MNNRVDFRPICPQSGEEMTLICASCDCNFSAFACSFDEGCIRQHMHHSQATLRSWKEYALPLRRAMEVQQLPTELEEGIRGRWAETFRKNQVIEGCLRDLLAKSDQRRRQGSPTWDILDKMAGGRYGDISGADMSRLIEILAGDNSQKVRDEVVADMSAIEERLHWLERKINDSIRESTRPPKKRNPCLRHFCFGLFVGLFIFLLLSNTSQETPPKAGEPMREQNSSAWNS